MRILERLVTRLGAGAALLLLAACTHERPLPVAGCAFEAIPLHVGTVHPRGFDSPFQTGLRTALAPGARAQDVLVLSGGSQHGLFGTGFFLGLADRASIERAAAQAEKRQPDPARLIPTYQVVTGVSTGSLQATLLFLANQEEPTDRTYPADAGFHPEALPQRQSNITDLAIASSISREASLLKVGGGGLVGALRRGAVGSLDPLRQRVIGLISKRTIELVAAEHGKGRQLYAGVVDGDSGEAYAVDLGELASRYTSGKWGADYLGLRQCYADALIASSSVPLAAFPVTLDFHDSTTTPGTTRQHVFMDGGARYGVFLEQLHALADGPGVAPINVTLIVNGELYSGSWQEKDGTPVRKWSALSWGKRAIDMLENQSYRASVDAAERYALAHGALHMAFISNEKIAPDTPDSAGLPPGKYPFDNKSCDDWAAVDNQTQAPQEFHPRYMLCLMNYGRARGRLAVFNYEFPDRSGS